MAKHTTCDACGTDIKSDGNAATDGDPSQIQVQPGRNHSMSKKVRLTIKADEKRLNNIGQTIETRNADICLRCICRSVAHVAKVHGFKTDDTF